MPDGDQYSVASAAPPVASPRADSARWRTVRRAAAVLYFATVVAIIVFTGVPTGRQTISVIVVVGLGISTIGRSWRAAAQVLIDWLPFTLVLIGYDQTRAVADGIGLPLHEADVVTWERWLCFGHIPTVWLQQHLLDLHAVRWFDALATVIYASHFLATPVLAAVLWLRDRTAWLRYISRVILLSVLGLITYVLFPEAPPWMASRDGYLAAHVYRLSARGWQWMHATSLQTALDRAQRNGSNPVAAMPSLHIAFAALLAIFLIARLRSRWRYLLILYPLAMGVALVYLGEHYVIDLLAGLAYAVAAHFLMCWWERHRARSQKRGKAQRQDDDGLGEGPQPLPRGTEPAEVPDAAAVH